ncbi:MAG TPA: hypothetical protein VMC09_07770 [Anaerolineales bacterium]|nr:hypothetical protein [Anaerolineales bacterium]
MRTGGIPDYPPINTGCSDPGELTDHMHTDFYMNLQVLVTWKP